MNMKLTKSKLKELIKEEFGKTLKDDIGGEDLWEELEDLIAWIWIIRLTMKPLVRLTKHGTSSKK